MKYFDKKFIDNLFQTRIFKSYISMHKDNYTMNYTVNDSGNLIARNTGFFFQKRYTD